MNGAQHLQAIKSGAITRTTVIGIRKAIQADNRARQGWSTSSTAPKLAGDELQAILREVRKRNPLVSMDLVTSGLRVITNRRYKRQLADVASIIPDVECFRLVDFWEENGVATPVYRAETRDRRSFEFYNIAWQSGGKGPVILSGRAY